VKTIPLKISSSLQRTCPKEAAEEQLQEPRCLVSLLGRMWRGICRLHKPFTKCGWHTGKRCTSVHSLLSFQVDPRSRWD